VTVVLFETLFDRFFDGWCIASRAYARAMELGGLEVRLHSWLPLLEERHPVVEREVGHMIGPGPRPADAYLWSGAFGGPDSGQVKVLQRVINYRQLYKKPALFYTMFERLNVQPELVPLLNQLDGVLVPCSANLHALQRAGVKNAHFVHVPFFDHDPHLAERCHDAEYDRPAFYWIGRWEPRKAPHNLIKAFMRAFRPGEATLTLKIGPAPWRYSSYALAEEVIAHECVENRGWTYAETDRDIRVIRDLLSQHQMVVLHHTHDVYVSASRGEGIDMPAFAAKLSGNRVITTPSGGPTDFLGDDDRLIVGNGTVLLPDYDAIWGRGSTCVDYRVEDLSAAMQHMAKNPRPPQRTFGSKEWPWQNHHAPAVGREVARWVRSKLPRAEVA